MPGTPATSDSGRLKSGKVLAGRYRIECILGTGGMGNVYRAEDLTLGETVALKVLITESGRELQRVEQLLSEVRLARKVSHPNVCRVHDVRRSDGLFFMTMEYIEGRDLASLIGRKGRLSSDQALEVGIQTAEGLAAIHAQGILHLDLKPANLMIEPARGVKITDFGIAGRTGEGPRGGTLVYMPPEQQKGTTSEASDIYTLGLVLYELVTGRRPFIGPSAVVAFRHSEVVPTPPSAIVDNIDPRVERLILKCLEKNPDRRPASARSVADGLIAARISTEDSDSTEGTLDIRVAVDEERSPPFSSNRLRRWPEAKLPDRPYPVLLPYTHPQLFAGRRRELGELQRMLRLQAPILGLHASSGTGKSSLLMGGLVPWLKASGWPVAYTRFPWEPCLADRLLGDLVGTRDGSENLGWKGFGDEVAEVARLAQDAPVLILDQVEELLIREDARPARAAVGVLLAATVQRRPDLAGAPCHWLLAYRQEYHGDVVSWLSDVLVDARAEGLAPLDGLPYSLNGAERFHAMSLEPLGAPVPGADPLEEATSAFLAAIEAPLDLRTPEGDSKYRLSFASGHADRLAEAFGRSRVARPEAPLVPELQVVLAHLLTVAGPSVRADNVIEIKVPDDVDVLIGEALEDHLRRALETAFPAGLRGTAQGRARALLALRELADATGHRLEGLSTAALALAIGEGGQQILERLAAPDMRLVVPWEHPDGLRWVLPHNRLAEAVVRLVEMEGQHGGLLVDTELLSLRRLVSLESALFELRGEEPDRVGRKRSQQIEAHSDALLFDEPTRRWWAACRAGQRTRSRRFTAWTSVVVLLLGLVATGTWHCTAGRAELRGLYEQIAEGEPEAAFAAFYEVRRRSDGDNDGLRRQLQLRERPFDILENGLAGLTEQTRGRGVLWVVEAALPLVEAAPDDPVLLANLLWAIDYAPARDPALAGESEDLRERLLESLWRRWPRPVLENHDWAEIPGGDFWMGSSPSEGRNEATMMDERPRHQVRLSPFWMLTHEVSNAEYRRLVPGHAGHDDLPALINWYEAYRYAAWLGGRLPTEAEWEYAARAGCPHVWCAGDGSKTTINDVAWWVENSTDSNTAKPVLRSGQLLEPNPWGLYDMFGNRQEWTADWYSEYPADPQVNPMGGSDADYRVLRGGNMTMSAFWIQAGGRGGGSPVQRAGCRVLLFGEPGAVISGKE